MPNNQAPVAFTLNPLPEENSSYSVLSQEGYRVVVANNPCAPLSIGQILKFNNNITGTVINVESREAIVQLNTLANVTSAEIVSWLPFTQPIETTFLVDPSILGSLCVFCANTNTVKPGFVGWSFYLNETLVAQGNDLTNHNVISFSGSSIWSPQNYRLEVRSFTEVTLSPLKYATYEWSLTSSTDKLTLGGYNDFNSKLYLS